MMDGRTNKLIIKQGGPRIKGERASGKREKNEQSGECEKSETSERSESDVQNEQIGYNLDDDGDSGRENNDNMIKSRTIMGKRKRITNSKIITSSNSIRNKNMTSINQPGDEENVDSDSGDEQRRYESTHLSPFDAVLAAAVCSSSSNVSNFSNGNHGNLANMSNNSGDNIGNGFNTNRVNQQQQQQQQQQHHHHNNLTLEGQSSITMVTIEGLTNETPSATTGIAIPTVTTTANTGSLSTLPLPVRKRVTKATTISNPGNPISSLNHRDHGLISTSSTTGSNKAPDKGLRHFSMRVAAKVEERGVTTYNEVAEELVTEIGQEMGKFDHKNVRRRVYDALNVLMAIDVIQKDKKEIRWLGLPNELASEMRQLAESIEETERRVEEKRRNLGELVHRLLSLKRLIHRNQQIHRDYIDSDGTIPISSTTTSTATATTNAPATTTSSLSNGSGSDKLYLPFILINAPRDCRVHCEMLEDRSQYFFEFDSPFLINEDIELLRLMGLGGRGGDGVLGLEGEIGSGRVNSMNVMNAIDGITRPNSGKSWKDGINEEMNWMRSWLSNEAMTFLGYEPHNVLVDGGTCTAIESTAMSTQLLSNSSGSTVEDEWDHQQVEAFLESMPPPIISNCGGGEFPLNDDVFNTMPFSSPIKKPRSSLNRSTTMTNNQYGATKVNRGNHNRMNGIPILRAFQSHHNHHQHQHQHHQQQPHNHVSRTTSRK